MSPPPRLCTHPSTPVYVGGIAFAFLFTAYNTAQNYVTTLIGAELGSLAITMVYIGVIATLPFAPTLVTRAGVRLSLGTGALTYVLFMLALAWHASHSAPALVVAAALFNGVGGALMWSAQGSLVLLASTPGDPATHAGDFWALFHISTIVGNAWALLSFSQGGSSSGLFLVFAAIASIGSAMLYTVGLGGGALLSARGPAQGGSAARRGVLATAASEAVATCRAMRRHARLLPLLLLGGLLLGYQSGVFPLFLRRADVGGVFVIFGVGEVSGALAGGRLVGRLSTRHYRMLCLALTCLSLLCAAPLELGWLGGLSGELTDGNGAQLAPPNASAALNASADVASDDSSGRRIGLGEPRAAVPILAAALFGLSDSALAVLAYAELGRSSGGGTEVSARAGATRMAFTSVGLCASFAFGPYVPGAWQLIILTLLLVVAFVALRGGDEASAALPIEVEVRGTLSSGAGPL